MNKVNEIIEFHGQQATRARLVAERFPNAWRDDALGAFVADGVEPNELWAVVSKDGKGDTLAPVQRLERGDVTAFVAKRMWFRSSVNMALNFLREKHPEAYADLVKCAKE